MFPAVSRALATGAVLLGGAEVAACSPGDGGDATPAPSSTPSCIEYTPLPVLERDEVQDVRVVHGPETVIVEAYLRDVVDSNAQSWTIHVQTPVASWSIDVFRSREHGNPHRTRTTISPDPAETPRPDACGYSMTSSADAACPGLIGTVDTREDAVRVVVPRPCLGTPEWVRAGVAVLDGLHEPTSSNPALGPQVPVI